MPPQIYTLTDPTFGTNAEDFEHADPSWGVVKMSRMKGGVSDGIDKVMLLTSHMKVFVLPTRGMGILSAVCRRPGIRLGWDSPVRHPVHPHYVDLSRRGGIGWLDGFNEWLCRCGLSFHGPPGTDAIKNEAGETVAEALLTLHGRIANLPAHKVWVEIDEERRTLAVVGEVDETSVFDAYLRLTSRVEIDFDSTQIRVTDEVENVGGAPAEFELLYHINNGPPLLGEGATCITAFEEMAPRDARAAEGIDGWQTFAAPQVGFAEQVYFFRPAADADGRSHVLLKSAAGDAGLSLAFPREELPYFVLWKNTRAEREGYVTGLEPATSLPNLRTFEREHGRLINLSPGESRRLHIAATVHADDGGQGVSEAEAMIQSLQQSAPATVHRNPLPHWSPAG